jgi:hypothetical protein
MMTKLLPLVCSQEFSDITFCKYDAEVGRAGGLVLKELALAREAPQTLCSIRSLYSDGDLGGPASSLNGIFEEATSGDDKSFVGGLLELVAASGHHSEV